MCVFFQKQGLSALRGVGLTVILMCVCEFSALMTILLELPLPVVQRAHLTSLQPARNAVEMKRVLKI